MLKTQLLLLIFIGPFCSMLYAQYYVWEDPILNRIESIVDCHDYAKLKVVIDSIKAEDPRFYSKHLGFFLRANGKQQFLQREYTEAFKLFFDGLKIAEARQNEPEIGLAKLELSMVFNQFNEPQLAMKMLNEAEVIFKKLDQQIVVARCELLQAFSYRRLGKFEKSNEILANTLAIYTRLQDSVGIALASNSIGLNYKNLKKPEQAIPYYDTSIEIFKKHNNRPRLAKAYNNMANIYQMMEKWSLSLANHTSSITIKQALGDTLGIAVSYINMSVIYKRTKQFNLAILYGERSISLLDKLSTEANTSRKGAFGLMSELYEIIGNQRKALMYARRERDLAQQLRIEEEATLIDLFEKKQDVKFYTISDSLVKSKKELQTKFNAAKTENASLTREKSYVISTSLIIVAILLSGLAIMYYWRYKSTKVIKEELEITNEELYATRIGKEEKEVLLQEIHHRVKNNMQIISSLIRLQSNQIEDKKTQDLFKETQLRINSMALVHEQLYRTKNFETLELSGYLSALIEHLISSYQGNKNILNKVDVSFSKASIDSIIPIGLIVNEIVSNSLKHAFNDRETGMITVQFTENDSEDGYLLELSDDGIGDPENKNGTIDEDTDTLGMELIQSLTEQLDGTLKLEKSQGYQYVISLPKI